MGQNAQSYAVASTLSTTGGVQARARRQGWQARPAAADLNAPADGDVAVNDDRRRGRGAQSNASGRYEPLARVAFDDGWQSLEELPPFKTDGHDRTPRARSSPATIRPTSPSTARSIRIAAASMAASIASRGRPMPISGCRPGSISRPSCSPSPMPPSCWSASWPRRGYVPRDHRHRHQHRSLPADRARATGSCARILEVLRARRPSGRHRHQVGAGAARLDILARMARARAGQGRALGDHARSPSSPARWSRAPRRRRAGSMRCGNARRPACRPRSWWRRSSRRSTTCEIERILDARRGRRGCKRRLRAAAAAAGGQGPVPRMADGEFPRPRPPRVQARCARRAAARTTMRTGASA